MLGSPAPSPRLPSPALPRFSQEASFLSVAAPPNPNREVAGDTIIFRDTQISSRAVYQCNTSNEHGYLLANAFVSVLGACPRPPSPPPAPLPRRFSGWSLSRVGSRSSPETGQAGGGNVETGDEMCGEEGGLKTHRARCAARVTSLPEVSLGPSFLWVSPSGPVSVSSPWGVHADPPGVSAGRRAGVVLRC